MSYKRSYKRIDDQLRRTGFLSAFILAVVISMPQAFAKKRHGSGVREPSAHHKEIPVNSGRSVRQQVDTFAEMMVKELSVAKNKTDKFRAISRVEERIATIRDNNTSQSPQDEAYMDLMESVFESLPREKEFKGRDCDKYRADLLNQFDPTSEDEAQEPAVKPGWAALQSLCK